MIVSLFRARRRLRESVRPGRASVLAELLWRPIRGPGSSGPGRPEAILMPSQPSFFERPPSHFSPGSGIIHIAKTRPTAPVVAEDAQGGTYNNPLQRNASSF
jgi:hypothetical protein